MADVTPARENIQIEETRYRSSVSEATFTKVGGSVNFINNRQYDSHSFNLNGQIGLFSTVVGPDGVFNFLFDAEIVGFSYHIGSTTGSSSSVIVDIHRLTGGDTDAGSIFFNSP